VTYFPALVPDAAPLAIMTREDALALLPAWMKTSDVRPVTDALLDALLAIVLEGQYRGSYAAAQSHIARAAERYLIELAAERGVLASDGEEDATLRARVSAVQQTATAVAIREAVNAILAPHTDSVCQVIEPALDRWFVRPAATATGSWVGGGSVGVGISPPYTDRLYPSDSTRNDGQSIASSEPMGARVYADRTGRLFQVLVPHLSGATEIEAFAWGDPRPLSSAPDPRTTGPTTFVGGDETQVGFFIRSSGATADVVMRSIDDAVAGIAGHSMRWLILSDQNL